MTNSTDNGQPTHDTPDEVRINVRIVDVDPKTRTASAVVGEYNGGNPLDLTFAPDAEGPDDLGTLAGKRAWVEGPFERGENRLLSHIYVQHLEEGSNWMSVTETLERDKVRPPRKSKIAVEGFDFDVDDFLESIYEGRGRSWRESKID